MTIDKTAKNLLLDRTCDTCWQSKSSPEEHSCLRWLPEAYGWQWVELPEENICEDWKGEFHSSWKDE